MFKRILVPLDGSDVARRALPIAAQLAKTSGGSIILFGVATTPVEYNPYPALQGMFAEATIRDDVEQVNTYLQVAADLPVLAGLTVETHAVFDAIAPAIIAATQAYQADSIVMCSHGYSGAKRWLLGSVAQRVARHCPVPVLVLRADGATLSSNHPLRVLVPVDGSKFAEAALEPTLHLLTAVSGAARSELHLLRIVNVPIPIGKFRGQSYIDFKADIRDQEKQEARTYLAALTNRLRQITPANVRTTSSIVVETDIAAAIIHMAEQHDMIDSKPYDVIAMATHGRGGIQRWALGSITERVLGATRLPLLIVRPHEVHAAHQAKHDEKKESELSS